MREGGGWEREGDRQPSAASASGRSLCSSSNPSPHSFLATPIRSACRSPSMSFFFLRCLREMKRKGTVILMRIRLVYAAISYLRRAASRRRAATAAVARLMNALCKYYFCLCTRQLSATLVLINNAKQSAKATGS